VDQWTEQENKKKFGICAGKIPHGHNYILHVTLKGKPSKATGMIINLIDLKEILKTNVISRFDHKNLNLDIDDFKKLQPTTENLCLVIWNLLHQELGEKLARIEIHEEEELYSTYTGEANMHYITRVYKFSASHRLNNTKLSEEENKKIFGKCNNYNAHGHNFRLEVTIKGPIEPVTGMVYDVLDMDNAVKEIIIDKFDHHHLNEIKELEGIITTGENLSRFIWQQLAGKFKPAELHRIKLYETERNYFEYFGGE
jgi:6-pyruvoyltetrahydropterin/6-carboxytetrahydropterin synthase